MTKQSTKKKKTETRGRELASVTKKGCQPSRKKEESNKQRKAGEGKKKKKKAGRGQKDSV